jgi:hypothetical protein
MEPIVKMAMQVVQKRLRLKIEENHPVSGNRMAFEAR